MSTHTDMPANTTQDEGWVTCAHCEQEFASYRLRCPCCGTHRIDLHYALPTGKGAGEEGGDEAAIDLDHFHVEEAQLDRYWKDLEGGGHRNMRGYYNLLHRSEKHWSIFKYTGN